MTGDGDRTDQHADESVQLIFPLVAEPRSRPGWMGKSLAAGVIVAMLAVAVTVAVYQVRSAPDGAKWAIIAAGVDESGARVEFGSRLRASVFELRPGTCLRDIDVRMDVQDVPVVPCGAQHQAEVIATVRMPDGPWPGRLKVDEFAVQECVPMIFDLGIEPQEDLKWSYFGPTENSWTVRNDRTVSCVIASDGEPFEGSFMTGSMEQP